MFSGVSAGLTAGIDIDDLGIDHGEVSANPLLGFGKVDGNGLTLSNLLEGGLDNVISAGLSSAVYGTDFSNQLSTSLLYTVVNLTLADAQFEIGELRLPEGSAQHALLHGLAGCAAASAQGGSCAAGAAGGIAQSFYAGTDPTARNLSDAQVAERAKLWGGVASFVASQGEAENVSIGAAIAQSGALNNYLTHTQRADVTRLLKERAELCRGQTGGPGPSCAQANARVAEIDEDLRDLKATSTRQTLDLIKTCGQGPSATCADMLAEAHAFNLWTEESWNYDERDALSTGGDVLETGSDWSQIFDLDQAVVAHYSKVQNEGVPPAEASKALIADIARGSGSYRRWRRWRDGRSDR